MKWEVDGDAMVGDCDSPCVLQEPKRIAWTVTAIAIEAREDDKDEFEDFDEEDFDDDFDDDFEEEQDEEYDAENEEYPDTDFGTGIEVDEDLGEIEIDPDIEGDFDEGIPAVEPTEAEEDEGEADVVEGE
jgi:hypothetical protein